jgi:hypothetical protein
MEIQPMSNLQRSNIAAVAHDLPGQNVVLADGDELGVIMDVVETSAATIGVSAPAIVVDISDATTETPTESLVISGKTVVAVTDDAVVLGTTACWLDQHVVAELKRC